MSDWFVGQKVVCVNNECTLRNRRGVISPIVGAVYTIREIREYRGYVGFLFAEIANPILEYDYGNYVGECMYLPSNFRPVVSRCADISVFTTILDRVNQREVVEA